MIGLIVLQHLHLHLEDVLSSAGIVLVDVGDAPKKKGNMRTEKCDWLDVISPLRHDQGEADGLEVVPAVLV